MNICNNYIPKRLFRLADVTRGVVTSARFAAANQQVERVQEERNELEESDPFLKNEIKKYNTGKRWLARMMGQDPDNFSQKDVDEAIAYLLPSSLFAKDARPVLKHPYELFPKTKESLFDSNNRPLSSAFYTGKPKFYDLTYQVWELKEKLDTNTAITAEDAPAPSNEDKVMQWMKQYQLEQKLNEKLNEKLYDMIMFRLKKLSQHERANEIKGFLQQYQVPTSSGSTEQLKDVEIYDGVARAMGYRKTSIAEVIVRPGEGHIMVNYKKFLDYFYLRNDREQIMYPLLLTESLSKFNIEANAIGGGSTGKSGAIRLGISRAIAALCPEHFDVLNQNQLLTRDYRQKERKKPGRKKARRAFQWVKR